MGLRVSRTSLLTPGAFGGPWTVPRVREVAPRQAPSLGKPMGHQVCADILSLVWGRGQGQRSGGPCGSQASRPPLQGPPGAVCAGVPGAQLAGTWAFGVWIGAGPWSMPPPWPSCSLCKVLKSTVAIPDCSDLGA